MITDTLLVRKLLIALWVWAVHGYQSQSRCTRTSSGQRILEVGSSGEPCGRQAVEILLALQESALEILFSKCIFFGLTKENYIR